MAGGREKKQKGEEGWRRRPSFDAPRDTHRSRVRCCGGVANLEAAGDPSTWIDLADQQAHTHTTKKGNGSAAPSFPDTPA